MYFQITNLENTEVLDDPQLDERTYSLEVGNKPIVYILQEERGGGGDGI